MICRIGELKLTRLPRICYIWNEVDKHQHTAFAGNTVLPELALSSKGLDPLEGVLDRPAARHLLERSLFGARLSEIDNFEGLTTAEALDILLAVQPEPDPPVVISDKDPLPLGETWVNAPYDKDARSARIKSYRAWWVGQIIGQGTSLLEKMVLFWHNHFVTETNVVNRDNYLYNYNALLRANALGNFQTLTEEMTVNTAMLKYLNGDKNTAGSPNENYARELFELFTIGKGPVKEEGDYTFYTENDIQEAAKVLTGWRINTTTQQSWFDSSKHDKGAKTFSGYYEGKQIADAGVLEYKNLISMIFEKKETARRLARKLYRWFVYYIIDEDIEAAIIEPLASTIYDSGYEIKPALRQLLSSEHFFDETYRACYIRNPYEHIAGTLRKLEVEFSGEFLTDYELMITLFWQARNQEMEIGTPPDVAGWTQWYLSPQYNQLWINSVTLPQKASFSDRMLSYGFTKKEFKLTADVIKLVEMLPEPSDPNKLISDLGGLFLPVSLSTDQHDYLKGILIPGLPDFEWTLEWNKYADNPSDENQKKAIEDVLESVLKSILRMPEYYLM